MFRAILQKFTLTILLYVGPTLDIQMMNAWAIRSHIQRIQRQVPKSRHTTFVHVLVAAKHTN